MSFQPLLATLADTQPHHITELAKQLGCLPQQLNMIWQQVPNHLRPLLRQRDGYWQLSRPIAMLPENHSQPNFTLDVQPETESTNTLLAERIHSGKSSHRHIIVAHSQTQGRGRQGRKWQNNLGECLMFSLGWTFDKPQAELLALAPVTALACQQALQALGCPAQIKWPNDLVIGLDKLGGILIESIRKDGKTHAIIGIGINFMQPETQKNITSFQAAATQKHNISTLFGQIIEKLDTVLTQFAEQGFAPFQAAYEAVHRDQHQTVSLLRDNQVICNGRILGISPTGALRLQTAQGEQEIISGEISLRRPEQLSGSLKKYLLLDGGNSRLKWAWVENATINHISHAPYRDLTRLQQEWEEHGTLDTQIIGSAVCGDIKKELVQSRLPYPIEWLTSMPQALGMINHYRNPAEHGADRWFNALGSRKFSQNASVIVSCGTAVTVDAVTADKHYLGGTIMPGFHLMRESLLQRTAQLQRPEGQYYAFPTTTANAISTGMLDAVCGSIMLMHTRLKERCQTPVDIILTGGGANKILEVLPHDFTLTNTVKIIDNLVIYGLINWIKNK
ncbi:biotin--[acetyl-CoA-carboxylase] ligase [Kingella negevensis]|uniref:Type III pantothenate kinase n=1 Tax=Kingella negevensis TaxID=1522312 RepID=A0A238HHK8_9NEIS|nr:biotin--[acetyl-CoA-carboxylase] ligase [Kingella negevensis]MDK4684173.1 biotin--[acetyl-CoA-carboxylase] ligase [Kingella negevensis]MDK4696809.1 biotin--[acetyl-CoA-carboxylase] ligase [Kingella negevensis]MDK4707994.1 biotin--[acetyl-CoA-carboxylase] ligase [Kingella negevensis]MDK4709554.1 biotin--[acetyl-CoA-carboxylase] ligase [Kingella negevensis]SNB73505.1 Bifunctional ligase/repressor BirA [Kingella negevensis]